MVILRWFIMGISSLYFLAAGAVYSLQGDMLYFPNPTPLDECNTPEGVEIWQSGPEQGLIADADSNRLVLFFHGNAESACNWRYLGVNHLGPLGYDVLAFEYPGYSGDPRETSKLEIEAAVDNLHDWVAAQDYDKIYVMGYSLGTGVASIYAQDYPVHQVLLFAPYDSVYSVALGQGLIFPRFLLTEDFDNIAALESVAAPISILHGLQDTVIPAKHSANLFQALTASGREVIRETINTGHHGLFDSPAFDDYIASTLRP